MTPIIQRPISAARRILQRAIIMLDTEQVRAFQAMYYVIFMTTAGCLLFVPALSSQSVADVLNPPYYDGWLWMNFICPMLTLLGRRLTTRAAHVEPGKPNSAMGAAWLQLTGDSGVWMGVILYTTCVFNNGWWREHLYVVAFVSMGIMGGGMFTARSIRRLAQINRRDRRVKKHGWT
jgi:hypothetical protein